jgi:hypothetical protein
MMWWADPLTNVSFWKKQTCPAATRDFRVWPKSGIKAYASTSRGRDRYRSCKSE